MTMWADKGMSILTVIVFFGDLAAGYLLFSDCEERTKVFRKNVVSALASMASVAKCRLVMALALPETLLK